MRESTGLQRVAWYTGKKRELQYVDKDILDGFLSWLCCARLGLRKRFVLWL
jgi:hypothetical protein